MIRFAFICLTLAVSVTMPCVGAANDGNQFPIQGLVIKNETPVYSGPGTVHYPTEVLNQGDTVEIWRFDPGGWCAIRPVSGSFCLVPESAIEITSSGVGRVSEAGLQAWVGTRLGPVEKPLWQVRLEEGEVVEILGEASWPNPEGFSTIWFQIAPPAGEFRWIHRDSLQLADPATSLPKPDAGTVAGNERIAVSVPDLENPKVLLASGQSQQPTMLDDPFSGLEPPLVNSGSPDLPGRSGDLVDTDPEIRRQMERAGDRVLPRPSLADEGWRPARQPIQLSQDNRSPAKQPSEPGRWSELPERFASLQEPSSQLSRSGMQEQRNLLFEPNVNTITTPTFGDKRLSADLASLDLQIASEIIKPPEYWDLDRIASGLTQIQGTATEATEREQASMLIRKVDDLRRTRANLVGTIRTPTVSAVASGERPVGSGLDTSIELGATYDAHGWLNVLARDNGQMEPDFVLQDDTGRIIYQVSPAPGLNLHRYVKSRVGIKGQRGYNQRLKLNHVTADRIIVLEPPASNTARRF